jgi:hypothetical protein
VSQQCLVSVVGGHRDERGDATFLDVLACVCVGVCVCTCVCTCVCMCVCVCVCVCLCVCVCCMLAKCTVVARKARATEAET